MLSSVVLPSADTLDIILSHSFHLIAEISSVIQESEYERTHSNVWGAVDHISTISPVMNVSAASMLSMQVSIAGLLSEDKNGSALNCIASAPIVSQRLSRNAVCAWGGFAWSISKSD